MRRLQSTRRALVRAAAFAMVVGVLANAGPAQAAKATHTPPAQSGASKPTTTSGAAGVGEDQALRTARATGKPVAVTAAENATNTLTANPSGTLTLTTYAQPVRKKVGNAWQPLNATLKKNADGSISPTLSSNKLTLSGGGSAPLVTMHSGARSLSLTLPHSLPAPTLSGDSATYANLLAGIDLVISVDDQGGFSQVYVVHDADAAKNPAFAGLLSAKISSPGLKVSVDAAGGIHAADNLGHDVFTAPGADMWDSATTATATALPRTSVTAAKGTATISSNRAPGSRAHTAKLGEHLSGSTLTLTPDSALLTGAEAKYPEYVDPPWSTYSDGDWATVAENDPGQTYWKTSAEAENLMQVGLSPSGFWADTLINFKINTSVLYTGGTPKIENAYFYATNVATNNHSTSTTWLYAPSATLSQSNDTWNSWFTSGRNLGSSIGKSTFAQDSSAAATFPITDTTWLSDTKSIQTFALAGDSYSDESGNTSLYKVFDNPTSGSVAPSLSITYSHAPTATKLTTSPNASVIGEGSVALSANANDVDGGSLTATFNAWVTGHTGESIKQGSATVGANSPTTMWIPQSMLDADVIDPGHGGSTTSTTMGVSWSITVSNGSNLPVTVAGKDFTFTTAQPGAPGIYTNSDMDPSSVCDGTTDGDYTVGTQATFYVAPPSGSTGIDHYVYQLNAAQPVTVPADGSKTAINVVPLNQSTILSVTAVAASGNIGQAATCIMNAQAPPGNEAAGNISGGPNPDLLLPGTGSGGLPAGLWTDSSSATGQINATATNIGIYGNGASATDTSPGTFTGTEAVVGLFTGSGFNAVLDYDPTAVKQADGNNACAAQILYNLGSSLPLQPGDGANVGSSVFTTWDSAGNPTCATSIANGGNLSQVENNGGVGILTTTPASKVGAPDLLEIQNGALNDVPAFAGYTPGDYEALGPETVLSSVNPACTVSGTCTTSWAGWSIYSLASSTTDLPALFAVNNSTGAVYYYSVDTMAKLAYQVYDGDSVTATPVKLADSGFGPGTYAELQATAVNGTPGLWAAATTSTKTTIYTYTVNSDATALTLANSASGTPLNTSAHSWPLDDASSGSVTSAADSNSSTTLHPTGTAATWTSDEIFNPDLSLNGNSYLTSSTNAILDLTKSFTVSVWAKPETAGTTVVSQDGTKYPGLTLSSTSSGWSFSLADGDGSTTGAGDTITGGTIQIGAWTHLVAVYDTSTSAMNLYVDDTFVATGSHTPPAVGAAKALELGSNNANGTQANFFTGQLSQLQTWNSPVAPTQPYQAASYHQSLVPERILDTRSTTQNAYTHLTPTGSPLGSNATATIPIVGDTVTAYNAGTTSTTTIPATATAVAVDVTVVQATALGAIVTYADGSQRPITSSTNYTAGTTVTGYQIVPIGPDGNIALYNTSAGTAHAIVDITGYFTSDATASGDQTYSQLSTASRILDTRSSTGIANTSLTAVGTVAANKTLTLNVQNAINPGSGITITGVAINLTTVSETGTGYLQAYPTGQAPAAATALSYTSDTVASMAADVPVAADGTITIYNVASATSIIGDVAGYYTNGTTGLVYHSVNPTRLIDTRKGIGGRSTAIPATTVVNFTGIAAAITTDPAPVLALMLTATDTTANSTIVAYPDSGSKPGTSNLNWSTGQTIANLALTGIGTTDGGISTYASAGNVDLIADCSGYFAAS